MVKKFAVSFGNLPLLRITDHLTSNITVAVDHVCLKLNQPTINCFVWCVIEIKSKTVLMRQSSQYAVYSRKYNNWDI